MKGLNVWRIAYYTARRNIGNWKIFLLLIFLPLVFYLICLQVTPNIDHDPKMKKAKIAYFPSDSGPVSQQFEQYLRTAEVSAACDIQKVNSITEGNRLVREGKVEAFIDMQADSGPNLNQKGKTKIVIYSNGNSPVSQLLADNFRYSVGISAATGKTDQNYMFTSRSMSNSAGVEPVAVSPPGKVLKEADKYPFLGLLEMFSYGALLGSFTVLNSRKTNILTRLNMAPINRFSFAGGQLLGNFITLCPSAGLFIVYITYVWGDALHGRLLHVILTFLLFTAIITALGMIIGYLSKRTGLSALAVIFINGLSTGAAFVWALGSAQGFLKAILYLSPHYHTYIIVTDTIFEGPFSRIQSSFMAMTLIATIFVIIAIILGRRKPYDNPIA